MKNGRDVSIFSQTLQKRKHRSSISYLFANISSFAIRIHPAGPVRPSMLRAHQGGRLTEKSEKPPNRQND